MSHKLNVTHAWLSLDPPIGYFDVYFMRTKLSLHRNEYSFRSGLTQEDILAYQWAEDEDRIMEVRDHTTNTLEIQFNL